MAKARPNQTPPSKIAMHKGSGINKDDKNERIRRLKESRQKYAELSLKSIRPISVTKPKNVSGAASRTLEVIGSTIHMAKPTTSKLELKKTPQLSALTATKNLASTKESLPVAKADLIPPVLPDRRLSLRPTGHNFIGRPSLLPNGINIFDPSVPVSKGRLSLFPNEFLNAIKPAHEVSIISDVAIVSSSSILKSTNRDKPAKENRVRFRNESYIRRITESEESENDESDPRTSSVIDEAPSFCPEVSEIRIQTPRALIFDQSSTLNDPHNESDHKKVEDIAKSVNSLSANQLETFWNALTVEMQELLLEVRNRTMGEERLEDGPLNSTEMSSDRLSGGRPHFPVTPIPKLLLKPKCVTLFPKSPSEQDIEEENRQAEREPVPVTKTDEENLQNSIQENAVKEKSHPRRSERISKRRTLEDSSSSIIQPRSILKKNTSRRSSTTAKNIALPMPRSTTRTPKEICSPGKIYADQEVMLINQQKPKQAKRRSIRPGQPVLREEQPLTNSPTFVAITSPVSEEV